MKKAIIIIAFLFAGGFVAVNTGCEEEPNEACQQDMFCDGTVAVTACCTEGEDCYYTYNGKDYPDTDEGLAQLVEDLNCTTTKSASVEDAKAYIIARLETLVEEARILSRE